MPFSQLPQSIADALVGRGYTQPTPVQAAVIESDAEARDLLVSAQTGSGKTVAFGLAMAQQLLDADGNLPTPGAPLALIIAPTRELAVQIDEVLHKLAGAKLSTVLVLGGASLLGGRFSVLMSVLGAMIIQSMNTGILISGSPPEHNLIVQP